MKTRPSSFIASGLAVGLAIGTDERPPFFERHGWEFSVVPDLACMVVYCRVTDSRGREYFVVNTYQVDGSSLQRVVQAFHLTNTVIAFEANGQSAVAEVHSPISPNLAACLVAVSLHHGTLTDDRDWRIEVEGEMLSVQTDFKASSWCAQVLEPTIGGPL